MKTLLWLLSALLSLQCVAAQISLEVSGPGTVKPTKTLEMTCKVSGASLTDSTNMHCVHWVRQSDGKGLEWLGIICYEDTKKYAQSVQGRLTLTRDISKGEVYFKLTEAKPEESGKYYAAREYYYSGSWSFDLWSDGQPIIVTSESVKKPTVFPLKSCGSLTSESITVGCLATDYVPGPVKIQWNAGAMTSTSKEMTIQNSGKYISASFLSIPQSSQVKESLTCTVEHDPSKSNTSKEIIVKERTIKIASCPDHMTFNETTKNNGIYLFCPHSLELEEAKSGSRLSLICMIKSYSKADINISWCQGRSFINKDDITEFKAEGPKSNVKFSMLTIDKDHWGNRKTYICLSSEGEKAMISIDRCKQGKN